MLVYGRGWSFILFLGTYTSLRITLCEFSERCNPTERILAHWRWQSPTQNRMSCSQLAESRECGKMYFWDRKGCGYCCWQPARMKRGRHCHRSQLTGNGSSKNGALASWLYRAQLIQWRRQGTVSQSSCLNLEQAPIIAFPVRGLFRFLKKYSPRCLKEGKRTRGLTPHAFALYVGRCIFITLPHQPSCRDACKTADHPEAVGCQGSGHGLWIPGPALPNCATLGLRVGCLLQNLAQNKCLRSVGFFYC